MLSFYIYFISGCEMMLNVFLESGLPTISVHNYWHDKQEFLVVEDIYEEWVAFIVESGTFQYEVKGRNGIGRAGDIIIGPPNCFFRRKVITSLSFHFLNFSWGEERSLFALWESLSDAKMSISNSARLHTSLHLLKNLSSRRDTYSMNWKNSLFYDLWLLNFGESMLTTHNFHTNGRDPQIDVAAAKIKQHALDKIDLRALAVSLHLSPVQLTRRFHHAFQINPSEYVTSLRLQCAKNLLVESNLTLSEIADSCGYENGYYLSRVFTKHNKMSPSQYRRAYQI
jgi:AraC family transcriptional regulator